MYTTYSSLNMNEDELESMYPLPF